MGTQLSRDKCEFSSGIDITKSHSFTIKPRRQFQILMMNVIVITFCVTVAVRVVSDFESLPFIGLSLRKKSCEDITITSDPDLIFWSLTERLIYWKGKMYCRTHVVYTTGCEVEISWSFKRNCIRLWVKSTTGDVQTDEIPVEPLDLDKFWPIFGAINVGSEQMNFEILDKSLDFQDVTKSVRFSSAGGKIDISTDGKTISRSSKGNGNSVALLNKVIKEGTHHWKLEVISDFGASIGIGLAIHNFQLSEKYRQDPLRHVYHHKGLFLWRSYRGFLYSNGQQLPHSLEPLGWQSGPPISIELSLNMKEGTLEIFRNGKSIGIAFTDIRGPVQPAVAFYAAYEKEVRLLEFRSSHESSMFDQDVEADAAVHIVQSDKVSFDSKSLKGKLMLADDGMTLYRQREQSGNAFCLLNVTLLSGFHRWSFVIQNDQGASTCVGVAKEPILLNTTGNVYTSPNLYVLRSFQGILYREGKELKKRCSEFWLSGSLIEVSFEVTSQGGVLQYAINGEEQGIAFTDINPPVRPFIGFYAGMEKKITLVHYEHKPLEHVPLKVENDLSKDTTSYSTKHNPLPIFIRPKEVSLYCDTCMVCGDDVSVIALPCKHSTLCANHLVSDGSQSCLACDQTVTGVWNILLKS